MSLVLYITLMVLFFGKTDYGDAVKLLSSGSQKHGVISRNISETVTFQCLSEGIESVKFYLYRERLGQNPLKISSYLQSSNTTHYHQEFTRNQRISLRSEKDSMNWTISDLEPSDSGRYFCASSYSFNFEFSEGVFLSVKTPGDTVQVLVHPEGFQHPETLTVGCRVQTANCHEEQRVFWFHSSTDSKPGILYSAGLGDNRCERDPENHTRTCFYELPREGLIESRSDTETFYCAVVSCGVILFGSGVVKRRNERPHLIYGMAAALALTTLLVVMLTSALYKMKKRTSSQGPLTEDSVSPTVQAQGGRPEGLHYAAIRVKKGRKPARRREDGDDFCVYSAPRC